MEAGSDFSAPRCRMGFAFLLCAAALLPPSALSAQQPPRWALGLSAGFAAGELPGPGSDERSGFALALRLDRRVAGRFVLEPGVSGLLGSDEEAVFPEVSLQVEATLSRIRPYVGAGAGWALLGDAENEAALHTAAGARYVTAGPWDVRAEVRPRWISGGWYLVELTAGITRVLR